MLFRLKRLIKEDDRIMDIKKHEFYLKPSEKRKQKQRRRKTASGDPIK